LSGIAVSCGTTVAAIQLANPGLGYWAYAGQTLRMPGGSWDNGNGSSTYIVARGDTLKMIAIRYGVTMDALANANGIYNYNLIYVGQVLTIPGAYTPPPYTPPTNQGGAYVVQPGDTLRIIANRIGVTVVDILNANPNITNPSLIYVGQVIYLPGAVASYYTVQRGDTLRIIANLYGTSVYNLELLNPQIWNPNLIYVGMTIRVH
jgi:LysM repeat protein